MNLGLDYLTNNYYMNQINQQNKVAEQSKDIGFNGVLSSKAVESAARTECSFKDMWQARFPGAYYHVMDAYKISTGSWGRYDFPHEQFFNDNVDESVLDWKPTGAEPKLTDKSVQSRIDSTLGKKAIVVPPALEEKMKNDPTLAQKVMEKVERFIVNDEASLPPGRIYSCVVILDENGEIAHAAGSSGGGNIVGPTEEEQRQFEAEQAEKRKRRAEYMRILEESSQKRVEIEQENRTVQLESELLKDNEHHYQQQKAYDKAIESYEKGTLL